MHADGVAHERHPVGDRGLVVGLAVLVLVESDEGRVACFGIQAEDARWGCISGVRVARDAAALPDEVARRVVVARVLFGQVDVAIGAPIGLAHAAPGCGGTLERNLDIADLLVGYGVLEQLHELRLIAHPAVGAAAHGDGLAVGAGVGPLAAYGVDMRLGELVHPLPHGFRVERWVQRLIEGDPLSELRAVERGDDGAPHLEVDVRPNEFVGTVDRMLKFLLRGAAGKGSEAALGQLDARGEGRHGHERRAIDGVFVQLAVGEGLCEGERTGLGIESTGRIESSHARRVELIDCRVEAGQEGIAIECLGKLDFVELR